ncbi:uncharacterized protein [Panulirus ornatus]|uniref:uncharacterized protein n=1 Tax=Panulirus ornatus TaxID=150431 RepID=UPI003A8693EC
MWAMVVVAVVLAAAAAVTAAPSEPTGGEALPSIGEGGRQGGNICVNDPPACDGSGVSHLPLGQISNYTLQGWWDLRLDSDNLKPQKSSRRVTLEGYASLTRESKCRVKVTLRNILFSDWQADEVSVVDTWVVVSAGSIHAVCGREGLDPDPASQHIAHIHSLARSIISSVLNVEPMLEGQRLTLTESDHFGQCKTDYHLDKMWPGGYEVVRTRDLTSCHSSNRNGHFLHTSALSSLTTKALWECHHQYETEAYGEVTLNKVMCYQNVSHPDVAVFISNLNLSLIDIQPNNIRLNEYGVSIHELDLETAVQSPTSVIDHTIKVHGLLDQLCVEMSQRVTSKAALTYPHLVSELKHLPKEMLIQLHKEVNTGRICPDHQRIKSVYSAALRDSASPSAAAAKCHLMKSNIVVLSPSWISSLANVHQPTVDAIVTCADLLDNEHWDASVLGVTAMAGHATKLICRGEDRGCETDHAVQIITDKLKQRLITCSSGGDVHQVLLAVRGLGNVGAYGHEVEGALQECAADITVNTAIRVASFSALGKGPCSSQILNWLKWEVLNETVETELRITAFQSLRFCNPGEAEAVAALIIKKESDTQVKSYVSAFVREEEATRDARQFSRHFVTNLTSLIGLPDTHLETDLIFQNSFLPRSVAFNLSSEILKHFGGSAQFGGRLENLEDVIQAIFGHEGTAGGTVENWFSALISKGQELFTKASEEFLNSHGRHKRSYSLSDVTEILRKVRHQVVTELRGWVFAGFGGQEHYFSSYTLDPFTLEWEGLINQWLEQLFETTYSSLINSDVEMTTGWAEVDNCVLSWSLLGTPLMLSLQEGGVFTLGVTSQVNLLSLLTNPSASTLSIAVKPSIGVYSLSQLGVASLTGDVIASSATQASAGVDVSAMLMIQGVDNVEFKVDIPQDSFHGYSRQFTHSLEYPTAADDVYDNDDGNDFDIHQDTDEYSHAEIIGDTRNQADRESGCSDEDHAFFGKLDGFSADRLHGHPHYHTNSVCNNAFEATLGIISRTTTQWARGKHVAAFKSESYLQKSEDNITGYRIGFSWKNPGVNSMFLDVHIEAEGSKPEKKAGLVFGVTYSPHFTLRILLHSQQFSAFAEATLVNDHNLKRIEGRIGFGKTEYGFKAELLMVTDGGHVSVKPRLVVAYPNQQEDALLEGYMARYLSDKVSSVTVDLYTEGTLKTYLDVTVKGTAEVRHIPDADKVITLKNIHISTPNFALGLEAAFSLKDDAVEGKVQVTWDGQVVMLDGSVTDLGLSKNDQRFKVNFQMLLPNHPQLDFRLLFNTRLHASEIRNNLTLVVGPEDTPREFQVIHSTSWRIARNENAVVPLNRDHSFHYSTSNGGLALKLVNKLQIMFPAADWEWNVDHELELTDNSLENLLLAKIGGESYRIMANIYDQSEDLFKYHTDIEITLPKWNFSYVDTLEQRQEGDVIGQSTTIMPSGRIYTTSSRYFKRNVNDETVFEFSYNILVHEGLQTWRIFGQTSFKWTLTHLSLQASVEVGDLVVFGLEASLAGLNSRELDLFFKNWAKNLYECEVSFTKERHKTDFSFSLFVIPFNREIKSKVALDHDQCTGGSVDGELAWDARGDTSRTLSVSSVFQFPSDRRALEIQGSLSLLTWKWETQLEVVLGDEVGDSHQFTYILIFPDRSRFEVGSQLDFLVGEDYFTLSNNFGIQMPSRETHNVSVTASGHLTGNTLNEAALNFTIESPITKDILFDLYLKNQKSEGQKDFGITLRMHSGANYWEPVDVRATGVWDGTRLNGVVEGYWGNFTLNFDVTGSYVVIQDEHRLKGSTQLKIPSFASCKQLKSSLEGTFIVSHSPGKLKMTHTLIIEKEYQEVLSSSGKVTVLVPKVEGYLTLTHVGSVASSHVYTLEGIFTGRELELNVVGTVDESPLKITIHYIDGRQVTIHAMYQEEGYFSLSITTELKNISIGIRKGQSFLVPSECCLLGNGTSYSLTTEGQLMYLGQSTELHHQLSISTLEASSILRLSPFLGRDFILTTSRRKIGLNHWGTDISLSWGERSFTYHDEVNFLSFSEWFLRIEVDSPDLHINKVMAKVETVAERSGEQAIQVMFQEQNVIIHSAKLMFYKYDTANEKVWRAGAKDVMVSSQAYSDLVISHAIILPIGGMEIKSNMTLGETPVIGIGIKVTPHTRGIILSVCTTSEECVRVRAHAHAQSTPSTRTYSIAAHALNSLFWKGIDDPLLQNSVTFMAEETSEKVTVSGGIHRVECEHVNCNKFITRGLLHATIHVSEDTLHLLVDTTNRTMKFVTVVRETLKEKIPPATLPGGSLVDASSVETCLWMDLEGDPQGMISWNSTLAHFASSRASEWVVQTSLHHQSFDKVLMVGGNIIAGPASTSAVVLLDIFSSVEDSLEVELELLQEHGNHILVANFTKAMDSSPHIMDVVVSFLPSPDSGEVSIELVVPSIPVMGYHTYSNVMTHPETPLDTKFTLTCGMDARNRYTTLSCVLLTPSVHEKVFLRYHLVEDAGCWGFGASLGMFNNTYHAQQRTCFNPTSLQSSLSRKTHERQKEELSLKFGVLDTRRAEIDLFDLLHIRLQLYPPFLLHIMAHSGGSMWNKWEDITHAVQGEVDTLLCSAKTVVRAFASDISMTDGLSRIDTSTPAYSLSEYLHNQAHHLLLELMGNQLLLDIAHGVQSCADVTSIVLEAAVAYLSHNYGQTITDMAVGAQVWFEAAFINIRVWLIQLDLRIRDVLTSTLNFALNSPQMLLHYALQIPVIGDVTQGIIIHVRGIQKLTVFTIFRDTIVSANQFLHKMLFFLNTGTETLNSKEIAAGIWNIWVPLPECGHSLLDVWNYVGGIARTSRHKVSLSSAVLHWWHLLTHPAQLIHYLTPPFTAHGAIIGETNFISLDGQTYSLAPSCAHILVTDARDGLFTLISNLDETLRGRDYTLLLGDAVVNVHPDLQVTINDTAVSLPYISKSLSVLRNLHHFIMTAKDSQGRDLVTLTCWSTHQACVVSVSGWFHADTRGLLGNLNLDPANDFMRPSGKVALGGKVFSQSWRVSPQCLPERAHIEVPPDAHAHYLCDRSLLHYTSPIFPCHDTVDIMPFHDTCIRHLVSLHGGDVAKTEHSENITQDITHADNAKLDIVNQQFRPSSVYVTGSSSVIESQDVRLESQLTYKEQLSPVRQLDLMLLVSEDTCDNFMYHHLIRPLPLVLERIANGKNVSDIKVAALGYGSGDGDVVYHVSGPSFLMSISQLADIRFQYGQHSQASLLQGLKAISNFPFRPGSVRIAFVVRCDDQDLPKFSETLLKEIVHRRVTVFTLTPNLLVFNPSRPKAVRNIIGVDRSRVYNLRLDQRQSSDSWSIRRPNSNIAQLAFKSGGGVFSVTALREDDKATYYMKLFRRVLSRTIIRAVNKIYRQKEHLNN